ncbi:MAG TPA: hypothetical protein VGN88_14180 [Phycisphaerae bacterium]|jgi:hypothetical protein
MADKIKWLDQLNAAARLLIRPLMLLLFMLLFLAMLVAQVAPQALTTGTDDWVMSPCGLGYAHRYPGAKVVVSGYNLPAFPGRSLLVPMPFNSLAPRWVEEDDNTVLFAPWWLLLLMPAPIPLLWWRHHRRFHLENYRIANGLCTLCGYDLRGTQVGCPECGRGVLPVDSYGNPRKNRRRGIKEKVAARLAGR